MSTAMEDMRKLQERANSLAKAIDYDRWELLASNILIDLKYAYSLGQQNKELA